MRTPIPRWANQVAVNIERKDNGANHWVGDVTLYTKERDEFFKHVCCKITEVWLMGLPGERKGRK